jgi:penicillin-binding protein 2
MRKKIVNLSVVLIFLFLSLGLLNLQVLQSVNFKELSEKNCIRLLPQEGARGKILDRNGVLIAGNAISYDAMILPEDKDKIEKALVNAARVLATDLKDLKNRFKAGYVAPFLPVAIAKNIDLKKAIALEELKLDLPNIVIQPHPVRYYPYGRLACHILGYLNEIDHWRLTKLADYGYKTKDIVGFGGVEEKYDYYLRQEEGALSVEVDHRSRFVRVLGFRPPRNGRDIQLTLDLKIQQIVEDYLRDRVGSIVIIDPYSGQIIAMASSPDFNPSIFINKSQQSIEDILENLDAPLINRSISSAYPAGSVFKLIVATAALEKRKINLSTTFFCPGSIHIGRDKFACWDMHSTQDLVNAITHSCNVFFYRTGLLTGAQLIHDYALKFGFAKTTSIDLPYEAGGFVPDPLWKRIYRFKHWFDGDTANLSIGQGDLLVTPLQVARMMAVFANGGYLVNPYIVKSVDGKDISGEKKRSIPLSLKPVTIEAIRRGLRNVVDSPTGTASILSSLAVPVAGKTGTAQVSQGAPHGWLVGFFPYKKPKFVICVFLEHGGSGLAASILTKQIIERMIEEGLI